MPASLLCLVTRFYRYCRFRVEVKASCIHLANLMHSYRSQLIFFFRQLNVKVQQILRFDNVVSGPTIFFFLLVKIHQTLTKNRDSEITQLNNAQNYFAAHQNLIIRTIHCIEYLRQFIANTLIEYIFFYLYAVRI